jgi:hypothetical protein
LISPPTSATLGIRVYFCLCIGTFYAMTGNPLFLVTLAVVGLGFVLTLGGHLADRRQAG